MSLDFPKENLRANYPATFRWQGRASVHYVSETGVSLTEKGGLVGASLNMKSEGFFPSRLFCCRLIIPVISQSTNYLNVYKAFVVPKAA